MSGPDGPIFHAEDWFTITGRGPVAAIRDHGYDDPRELQGQHVVIDDVHYGVKGVETNLVPGGHRHRPIGLLVEPLDQALRANAMTWPR